jgi:cytochrome c peroxidase
MQLMSFAMRRCRAGAVLAWIVLFVPVVRAAPGDIIENGTSTSPFLVPAFLFEPEVPVSSLKGVPSWNELEQLLDNPYNTTLCSVYAFLGMPSIGNTPGNDQGYPSVCTTPAPMFARRPTFGVTLPPLLLDPVNYNPTSGERMRLLDPTYPGGNWTYDELFVRSTNGILDPAGTLGFVDPVIVPACPTATELAAMLQPKTLAVSPGTRMQPGNAIDYNSPVSAQPFNCIPNVEVPEVGFLLGRDPGEPAGYSRQAVNTPAGAFGNLLGAMPNPFLNPIVDGAGNRIIPRNAATGVGGLKKPSIRVPPYGSPEAPGYLVNSVDNLAVHGAASLAPSNENDYVRGPTLAPKQAARLEAMVLGKALFWDMQVGSDGVQSCGTCHFHAGADNRTKNQLNPNHIGGDNRLDVGDLPLADGSKAGNYDLKAADFPLHKVANPDIAGDPLCANTPGGMGVLVASVNAGVLENTPAAGLTQTVCDANNVIRSSNDVASSMGVKFGMFQDIPPIGSFSTNAAGVNAVLPDLRAADPALNQDFILAFAGADGSGHQIRRVEPRNTPTLFQAALNFDNFWDGRANHDFQGGSVFGASDPQSHVFVNSAGNLVPTRQIIHFASLASLATGPGLSEFEMSFLGRNWAKIGKKLLQAGATPLANQLVSTTDSILGRYSSQGGSSCTPLLVSPADRSGAWPPAPGKTGLCISYNALIRNAFYPALWQNGSQHLHGCYTSGHPNPTLATGPEACPAGTPDDPFDHYVLSPVVGPASVGDTNQFTQMEANFSLFWGLSIHLWGTILIPDDTPLDKFLDQNPDAFKSSGEPGEAGLVPDLPNCVTATQRNCFRPVGNFQRDVARGGTRTGGPDPLLGFDVFFASNLSLKNPNFRSARCGECHAAPTLTDNTVPFTFKAQLRDFVSEFLPGQPGIPNRVEPLGRGRVITGFLLESEMNETGQDAVERRMINQSIIPNPVDGLAYPDGIFNPAAEYVGAGQSFFDNGVYNLGVTPCAADQSHVIGRCDDDGRGHTDAFGWPLSLATKLLKNLGGNGGAICADAASCSTEPGVALVTFDPALGTTGGLMEETSQDQQVNPGVEAEEINPLLPPYLAPWVNAINVGDAQPELDEVFGAVNTLTNVPMLEGFVDVLGPFNPAGVLNEALNNGDAPLMGTYPIVNRVGRFGSFKAPQLREVELTGPYFHNGGKLTLRQVVDFYTRGGDFPMTNAAHRDFNIVNLNMEVQSNLTEAEKVALVDFLLELTDDRVRFERAPFDRPQVIVPLDGTAPENIAGRDAMLQSCVALAPGQGRQCTPVVQANGSTAYMFRDVEAVGAAGTANPLPSFLGLSRARLEGAAAFCGDSPTSHYCH